MLRIAAPYRSSVSSMPHPIRERRPTFLSQPIRRRCAGAVANAWLHASAPAASASTKGRARFAFLLSAAIAATRISRMTGGVSGAGSNHAV